MQQDVAVDRINAAGCCGASYQCSTMLRCIVSKTALSPNSVNTDKSSLSRASKRSLTILEQGSISTVVWVTGTVNWAGKLTGV